MRILHAIHDFLPRHPAGSEIYALALCRELARRHHVTVLCEDYDLSRAYGHVPGRVFRRTAVVEIVNNWVCRSFEDTYRPPLVTAPRHAAREAVRQPGNAAMAPGIVEVRRDMERAQRLHG